jgi:hypothetical protein
MSCGTSKPVPPSLLTRFGIGLVAWLGGCGVAARAQQSPETIAALAASFEHPPARARPLGWWDWVNGNVTAAGIAADLEAAKAAGLGGVQLFDLEMYAPPGPVRYGSADWLAHVRLAIATCAELDLEFHAVNSAGWSGSGGPWIGPERAMKQVVFTATPVRGGVVDLVLPAPQHARRGARHAAGGFTRDLAVFAVPADAARIAEPLGRKIGLAARPVTRAEGRRPGVPRERVLDLSPSMDAAGRLRARLPPGEWNVLRFGFASTGMVNHPAVPEGRGLEVDKLDAAAVEFQFERAVAPLIRAAGPLAGQTFNAILFDSFEAGFQNWTASFADEFRRRKGYDFMPWLPLLAGVMLESEERSEAVLWDFRDVIETLLVENYFGTMRRLAARHGIRVVAEAQGGPLNPMACNRSVDVPMNEFWLPDVAPRAARIKQTTSSAAFLGRQIVAAEAFTAKPEHARFLATPAMLKGVGDHAFTLGINRFCLHSFTHQPFTDAAPGFSRGRYGSHFGRLVTWWPLATAWVEYVARCSALLQAGRPAADICLLLDEDLGYGLPSRTATAFPGFDFLAASPPDLEAMQVEGGSLVHPTAGRFRILVTPQAKTARRWVARLATVEKLAAFVRQGAWLAGPPPAAPAGLGDLERRADFDRAVAAVWGTTPIERGRFRSVGEGRVFAADADPAQVLRDHAIQPAVSWSPAEVGLRWIRRDFGDGSLYFIQRFGAGPERITVTFREQGLLPEVWDPLTGSRIDAPIFHAAAESTSLPFDLEPEGSVFVVFQRPLPSRWLVSADPVRLDFKAGPVLAAGAAVRLRSSDGAEETVTTGAETTTQTLPGPWRVEFTAGASEPFGLDAERRERLRGRVFTSWKHWDRDAALLPSGLLGPVVISRTPILRTDRAAGVPRSMNPAE